MLISLKALGISLFGVIAAIVCTRVSVLADQSLRGEDQSLGFSGGEARVAAKRGLIAGETDSADERRNYPYFTMLDVPVDHEGGHFYCGATLIHADILLSAAQCNIGATGTIIASVNATSFISRNLWEVNRTVTDKLIFPGYFPAGNGKDLMLLKLESPVSTIKSVRLHAEHDISSPVTVIGLGVTDEDDASSSDPYNLQKITTPVIDESECNGKDLYFGIEIPKACGGHSYTKAFRAICWSKI